MAEASRTAMSGARTMLDIVAACSLSGGERGFPDGYVIAGATQMFSGSIPALVTPFRDGALDEGAFRRFVDWQIDEGSSALVPCGTTGEASTMDNDEHYR